MTSFPKPPPLKRKPERPSISAEVRKKIAHPHLFTQLVIMSGCMSMSAALLAGAALYVLLRPLLVRWNVPTILPVFVIGGLAWAGFVLGARVTQRLISEALRDKEK